MNTKKILIVEDDIQLQGYISRKLQSGGYDIHVCDDGANAISQILMVQPDLVLLDIILPHKNGFEILEEIRITHQLTVPVMILTNLDQPQDKETGSRLQVSDYIIKSNISLDDLLLRVNELLMSEDQTTG